MCFYNDSDWTAEIHDVTRGRAELETHCDECGAAIQQNDWRCDVFQQQYEVCEGCGDCEEEEHSNNPGETFRYTCCKMCDWFVEAIAEVEKAEGCPPSEQRPAMCGLYEELGDIHRYDGEIQKYLNHAITKHPALTAHPPVAQLFERCRELAAELNEE